MLALGGKDGALVTARNSVPAGGASKLMLCKCISRTLVYSRLLFLMSPLHLFCAEDDLTRRGARSFGAHVDRLGKGNNFVLSCALTGNYQAIGLVLSRTMTFSVR